MKKIIFSAFAMLFPVFGAVYAQEATQEKLKTIISLSYYKNSDNTKTLKASAISKKERKIIPLKDVIIQFYATSDENGIGEIQTNIDGEAILNLPEKYVLADSLGNIILIAKFDGDDTYSSAEEEITIKDMRMELSLSEIDSVKTIAVTANEITGNPPEEEVDIYFFVQRLFGNLKIGEGLIEAGQSSIEFPNDIPGDSVGNITVIAKIEDNDTYGNVEKKESIAWGIPVHYTRENSGIDLSLLWGVGSHDFIDKAYLAIISVIIILLLVTITMYKRS